jgi:hypothetical protein
MSDTKRPKAIKITKRGTRGRKGNHPGRLPTPLAADALQFKVTDGDAPAGAKIQIKRERKKTERTQQRQENYQVPRDDLVGFGLHG